MQSVFTPPSTGGHLRMFVLCPMETRNMFILIKEEKKKVDAAKGVTELAQTSSSVFLERIRDAIYIHS